MRRRGFLAGTSTFVATGFPDVARATVRFRLGLTPVFLDNDADVIHHLKTALTQAMGETPDRFFSRSVFTYGHRNVVRAVASGLTRSGSVDEYVWETLASVEPSLTGRTKIITKSEWLGFPPFAARADRAQDTNILIFGAALRGLKSSSAGREALRFLYLDGVPEGDASLFDGIAARMAELEAR